MPKESQPRKNAYDKYFPLLFAFKFKVKFDGVKKKIASFVFLGKKKQKKNKKQNKKTYLPHLFLKKWPENLIPFFFSLTILEQG